MVEPPQHFTPLMDSRNRLEMPNTHRYSWRQPLPRPWYSRNGKARPNRALPTIRWLIELKGSAKPGMGVMGVIAAAMIHCARFYPGGGRLSPDSP
jgi:hypothetical protein